MIRYDRTKAIEFLSRDNVKTFARFAAEPETGIHLLALHYTRTSGTVTTQAALSYPDGSLAVMQLDAFRSVVANVEQWSDLERVCQILRAEIARYFFMKIARSPDDLTLFRHDQQRLLQVRFYLRQFAVLNRTVLAAIDSPREPLGVNELTTGLPDRLFWTDEGRGKLGQDVYFIRRTLIHDNVPNLLPEEGEKVNRHCFADIQISGRMSRNLRVEKSYPLRTWPTNDDILKEYAESITRMMSPK
ncbi:hypothetical protein BIZ78_gp171 [Erwinia phage vB_EamM_Caitlin]|uniref:hypothetical protein n=1 Tax=Erwinia phage vB_EamM_Caitlin TaxID=1883379 RepID=UPI00081C8E67|nr:hypothetical protein BIZ78_gp171 [Erwinia phage vB_EamM_Caitlin]ANZ48404.1 hypothetical protein CAITLIN_109 [Erwinia phage vB_EamM_Caitlin]